MAVKWEAKTDRENMVICGLVKRIPLKGTEVSARVG